MRSSGHQFCQGHRHISIQVAYGNRMPDEGDLDHKQELVSITYVLPAKISYTEPEIFAF
jgi:hypothetical protein